MRVEINPQYISQGVQGRIHEVVRINGVEVHNTLAKIYHDSQKARPSKKFIRHIAKTNLRTCPELECIPYEYFKCGTKAGIVMKRAIGKSLESSYEELAHSELKYRLEICTNLSRGISILHSAGIVVADINDVNIFRDGKEIRIIDIDGGGIPAKGIKPSVRGHSGGSILAPELFFDSTRLPDFLSDDWSLSVLNHKILIPGLDPYYFLDKYSDIKKVREWPPRKGMYPNAEITEIQLSLLKACGPLQNLFKSTFNEGISSPSRRTSARAFEETIRSCLQSVHKCQCCKKEFVAIDTNACPFCGKVFVDVILTLKNKEYSLFYKRLSLTAEEFGYQKNDRPLVTFQSDGHIVYCQMLDNLRIRYKGKEIITRQIFTIPVDAPKFLEIHYNGSRLQVVVYSRNSGNFS